MTLIGYTMMCEQSGPKQLVRDVALAEEACDSRSSGHSSSRSGLLIAAFFD